MVMIIFNLIEFFNVKIPLFFDFFDPSVFLFWSLVIGLFYDVLCFFPLLVFLSLFLLLRRVRLYFWL